MSWGSRKRKLNYFCLFLENIKSNLCFFHSGHVNTCLSGPETIGKPVKCLDTVTLSWCNAQINQATFEVMAPNYRMSFLWPWYDSWTNWQDFFFLMLHYFSLPQLKIYSFWVYKGFKLSLICFQSISTYVLCDFIFH